jgi:hypothetical protein
MPLAKLQYVHLAWTHNNMPCSNCPGTLAAIGILIIDLNRVENQFSLKKINEVNVLGSRASLRMSALIVSRERV